MKIESERFKILQLKIQQNLVNLSTFLLYKL